MPILKKNNKKNNQSVWGEKGASEVRSCSASSLRKGWVNLPLGKVASACLGPRQRQEAQGVVSLLFHVATRCLYVLACVMSLLSDNDSPLPGGIIHT